MATIEGKQGTFTGMLILGATSINEEVLYMCQGSGASINGVDLRTAQKLGLQVIKLQHLLKALLGKGDEI